MDAALNFGDFAVNQVEIDAADDELLFEAVKILEEKENATFCRFTEMSKEDIDRLVHSRACDIVLVTSSQMTSFVPSL